MRDEDGMQKMKITASNVKSVCMQEPSPVYGKLLLSRELPVIKIFKISECG